MQMQAPIPILRSFSEVEAKAFYVDYLGFEITFEHRFADRAPLYFEVLRGACRLHISEHHGDAAPGQALRIGVDDINAFHADITSRRHARLNPGIIDTPIGFREVSLTDPFYNRLIFCQRV
ncbi:glyoxalase superfamily protein [Jannaschia sp. CCS1]|uniref:glyoxalase superfamily protein n=1 Tax=Jannaschia sp. (strain CCS1) TaxID=290400 RepID=UPI000053CFF8|nr:glyoxalase superfamily protein [Jannaschia sp. CCS1]ABD53936.1 glyoxalase family protein [Jannaschia sp. CCS1]